MFDSDRVSPVRNNSRSNRRSLVLVNGPQGASRSRTGSASLGSGRSFARNRRNRPRIHSWPGPSSWSLHSLRWTLCFPLFVSSASRAFTEA